MVQFHHIFHLFSLFINPLLPSGLGKKKVLTVQKTNIEEEEESFQSEVLSGTYIKEEEGR